MFDTIITYSIRNKFVIGLLVAALVAWGIYSLRQLPIDAVPDITNNQVQVLTVSPSLATQEVEQFITTPVELALQHLQDVEEIRSVSRFGLSVVTVVFKEKVDVYFARQQVKEQLDMAGDEIPEALGRPELAPLSTGLGEIYQYVVRPEEGYEDSFSTKDLRTFQDWIVAKRLSNLQGVVEVNTLGGHLKQYEVAVDPLLLKSMSVSIADIFNALSSGNENSGGAYIEKYNSTYYIRAEGLAKTIGDIESIVVDRRDGKTILIKDVAQVRIGQAPRYGALTRDGQEVVGGTVMMLKGANSNEVTKRIKERVAEIQESLPEGVVIEPYLVRDKLITSAIKTVKTNLIEGGLIVIFILVLLLGNWRAGLIVASVIPLSMLFAVSMMNLLGISANLMSLGAIDFGLIVDGAVIIVEAIVHRFQVNFPGQTLTRKQMDEQVLVASKKIRQSAAFGEIIILMVYLPILALVGIEGKMFRPMAQTVMLAVGGALILSLTYVPMMSALFLNRTISTKRTLSDRIMGFAYRLYHPVLRLALRTKRVFVVATLVLFAGSYYVFQQMGGEFIPTLEEGDFALHQILPPGSSLSQSVETSKIIQNKLMSEFPEIEDIVTKIGSSEIPTDPMPVETGDIIVIMKPMSEWTSASSRQEMFEVFEESLLEIPGIAYEFSQPIQMRFNELMTGSRADIAIKLYGSDLELLREKALEADRIIRGIDGVATSKVEQTDGLPQIVIDYKYDRMAQYGLKVKDVNQAVRAAYAGEKAGVIYEEDRRFDLVVRVKESSRGDIEDVRNLYISMENGQQVPLSAVADVKLEMAPMQISRDNANRRIVIGVNAGGKDVQSLVKEIRSSLNEQIDLPAGYYFTYGGQFENLQAANQRLAIAVPIALILIFVLLYFTFGSVAQALLIFTAIPLSAIGGIWALQLRGMPFSISAGIGFIALFGVSVLNGIVLIGYFNQLKKEGMTNIRERIITGSRVRLRPVLMTAAVASLGFLPMALSRSGGAEVQRPLATVVIGGLITATFLTLVILPILYSWLAHWEEKEKPGGNASVKTVLALLLMTSPFISIHAQSSWNMEQAVEKAMENHPAIEAAGLQQQYQEALGGMKYQPGTTDLLYEGDGLFTSGPERVQQIGVIQNFKNPALNKAGNLLQSEYIAASRLQGELAAAGLKKRVREAYLEAQYYRELSLLYDSTSAIYAEYLRIAGERVKNGETGRLEELTLQNLMSESGLLQAQAEANARTGLTLLRQMVLSEEDWSPEEKMKALDHEIPEDATSVQEALSAQMVAVETAGIQMVKAGRWPDFLLGYAAQNYFGTGWRHGLRAGLQVPIFNMQAKQKVEAGTVKVAYAQAHLEDVKVRNDLDLASAEQTIQLYAAGVEHYRDQLENLSAELERVATLNYEAGQLSYLELLEVMRTLTTTRKNYLEQLYAYNKAVVHYRYLTNQ